MAATIYDTYKLNKYKPYYMRMGNNLPTEKTIIRNNGDVPIVEQETPMPTQPKPDRRLTFAEVQAVTPFWDDDAHGDHNERYQEALEIYRNREAGNNDTQICNN